MKRIIDKESVVGTYAVLGHSKDGTYVISAFHGSFVEAEEKAAKDARNFPGRHIMVATISLQLVGTQHVTVSEVLPEAPEEPEEASVIDFSKHVRL